MLTVTMNPALDKNSVAMHVIPTKKLRCKETSFSPGGGGVNVARVIHKMGERVQAVYLGGGFIGDIFENLLNEESINQDRIKIENQMRENFTVREEASGNQYRFVMPGAFVKKSEWEKSLDLIIKKGYREDFLVISGSLPPNIPTDFYKQLILHLRDYDVKIVVDTSGEPLKKLRKTGLYILKPNLNELEELTGRKLETEEDQEKAAQELIEEGTCEIVVLSLGTGGVLLLTRETKERFRSPTVKVISRIGAGDSTVAGMMVGLMRKMSLRKSVMMAVAAGAAAVMTPGTELCQKKDVDNLYKYMSQEKTFQN